MGMCGSLPPIKGEHKGVFKFTQQITKKPTKKITKMKINWGTGITIGMIAFMGFIVTMGVKMSRSKVDLVSKDYYEQGLNHENHMENVRASNSLSHAVNVEVNYSSQKLEITFPKEMEKQALEGSIVMFRPSDKNKDFTENIKVDSTLQQSLPLSKLIKGIWRVKIYWKAEGKEYYFEKEVVI